MKAKRHVIHAHKVVFNVLLEESVFNVNYQRLPIMVCASMIAQEETIQSMELAIIVLLVATTVQD
jgi:hypothetical protein